MLEFGILFLAVPGEQELRAGEHLKEIRTRLGITTREVEEKSDSSFKVYVSGSRSKMPGHRLQVSGFRDLGCSNANVLQQWNDVKMTLEIGLGAWYDGSKVEGAKNPKHGFARRQSATNHQSDSMRHQPLRGKREISPM